MKKKTVKMVCSIAVLAVLCGSYFGVKTLVANQEKQEEGEEDTSVEVFSASEDDIETIKFLIDKNEVTFTKKDDTWEKQDEAAFPVNQDKVNTAAQGLSMVSAERELKDVENLSEYGLDEPSNTITVETKDEKTATLRVGMENDATSQYYIGKDDDHTTVYVVDASVIEPFVSDSVYDYAESEAFPVIDSSSIKKIQVTGGNTDYTLTNDTDTGFWNISDGESTEKADSANASSLTSSISSMAYDKFVDYNCTDKSKYGLDKPYAEIIIDYEEEAANEENTEESEAETSETADAETETSEETTDEEDSEPVKEEKQLVIHVGSEADGSSRYVSVDDSRQVYTMSQDTLSSFIGKQKSDFWDLTVSYMALNNLEKLDVKYKGETKTINVSRETSQNEDGEDEETTSYKLDGKDVDSTLFTTFYNKVTNMAGQRRLKEKYETSSQPDMELTLRDTDGNTTEVDYYAYDTNYYAASVNQGEKVYLVNKMNVKEMITAYENIISGEDK